MLIIGATSAAGPIQRLPGHRCALVLLLLAGGPGVAVANSQVVSFTDVTTPAGLRCTHTIGDDRMTNIVESTGVGCGFVDYDRDGWLDIYLVNGCWTEGISDPRLAIETRTRLAAATDRLYRNQRDGTFEDVTTRAGLNPPGYGMAVVASDYDADGDTDLYVTNYGPNYLYRNNGDGTFTDVAAPAGVADPLFSVGAVFFDYDGDGWLDLYVGNYITYDPDNTPKGAQDIVRSPLAYDGQQDHLYRNLGDGTFQDVTERAGVRVNPVGRAMGVGALDFDGDGRLDIFVSNDAMENFLFHNQPNGTFVNTALSAGVAFSESGAGAAAMAVEVGDYDGDGLFDILVPDMSLCCLYHNLGRGLFEDAAVRTGLGAALNRFHSWGGVLADFNLDGHCDTYIANGHACHLGPQPNRLFLSGKRDRFREVSDSAGPALSLKRVSRGIARGDFDNDGDVDLLVANLNAAPSLLRNDTPHADRHWLSVELIGHPPNRDAVGALVTVIIGDQRLIQARLTGGSYLSQHDHRLHFGLGGHGRIDRVTVDWPGGGSSTIENIPANRRITVKQAEEDPGK